MAGIFLFHRDLRIIDNIGFSAATHQCSKLYPVFIFTPEQVSDKNEFKSTNSIQFMIEALDDLDSQLKTHGSRCHFFYGDTTHIIRDLVKTLNIQTIFFNRDYTPYAIKRDKHLEENCGCKCETFSDYYLVEPGTLMNGSGETYRKFTPFYKRALENNNLDKRALEKGIVTDTAPNPNWKSLAKTDSPISLREEAYFRFTNGHLNPDIISHGSRAEGLRRIAESHSNYERDRNTLAISTTELSPFIKFGCVSIREVYKSMPEPIRRQLLWRDFYAHILLAYPDLDKPIDSKYEKIRWDNNRSHFNAWCAGKTGFPVVDACMRQLNTTGYMHNRGRLIVASFLVKTLLIDWRWGEKYFATHLVDYDVASNHGNWLWIAGGGADSQEYFRIFNPWSQSKENDRDAIYIKKWVPELANVPSRDIHSPERIAGQYIEPIVNYVEQRNKVLAEYKKIFA
jgi:deoxyribodipyrimidine photo-lyase